MPHTPPGARNILNPIIVPSSFDFILVDYFAFVYDDFWNFFTKNFSFVVFGQPHFQTSIWVTLDINKALCDEFAIVASDDFYFLDMGLFWHILYRDFLYFHCLFILSILKLETVVTRRLFQKFNQGITHFLKISQWHYIPIHLIVPFLQILKPHRLSSLLSPLHKTKHNKKYYRKYYIRSNRNNINPDLKDIAIVIKRVVVVLFTAKTSSFWILSCFFTYCAVDSASSADCLVGVTRFVRKIAFVAEFGGRVARCAVFYAAFVP